MATFKADQSFLDLFEIGRDQRAAQEKEGPRVFSDEAARLQALNPVPYVPNPPYTAICRLKDKVYPSRIATGIAIGPYHVLTAGHNLINDRILERPDYRIQPAYHEGASFDEVQLAMDPIIHEAWTRNYDNHYDVALLITNAPLPFDIPTYPLSALRSYPQELVVIGYFGRRPSRMYWDYGNQPDYVGNLIGYDADTRKGQSGGGVFAVLRREIALIGIHVGGPGYAEDDFSWPCAKGLGFTDEIIGWIDAQMGRHSAVA